MLRGFPRWYVREKRIQAIRSVVISRDLGYFKFNGLWVWIWSCVKKNINHMIYSIFICLYALGRLVFVLPGCAFVKMMKSHIFR